MGPMGYAVGRVAVKSCTVLLVVLSREISKKELAQQQRIHTYMHTGC